MPDHPYRSGDDPADLDNTQPTLPPTMPMPPRTPDSGHVLPPRRGRKEKRKNDARATTFYPGNEGKPRLPREHRRDRSGSGLYLPAWSVLVMLVLVLSVAGGIILLVVSLGGNAGAPGQPRVIIVTAIPSRTPTGGEVALGLTLPANADGSAQQFALDGPILPTVAISPTPKSIQIGETVRVINVGDSKLNVRSAASTSSNIIYQAEVGTTFIVVGGPQTSENFTWWQLRATSNNTLIGWAVENDGEQDVLEVAAQ